MCSSLLFCWQTSWVQFQSMSELKIFLFSPLMHKPCALTQKHYTLNIKNDKNLQFFMINWQNRNFLHSWYWYFFYKCIIISPKIGKIRDCQNMNFLQGLYFLNVQIFFCINTLLFLHKSTKFTIYYWNIIFPRRSCFLNARFFCINMLLFRRKSSKFASNCQNINFPWSWLF